MARKLSIDLFFLFCAATLATGTITASAAPLAPGTSLKFTPGAGSGVGTVCNVGSCIGWEVSPGLYTWFNILPGTDGGLIVGKSQAAGELNAASILFFFGAPAATLDTLPDGATANVYDDINCTQAACIGKTALKTLNMFWNGNSIPLGSAAGCTHVNCTADQQAGIFVNQYTMDLVGKTWSMDYSQVVPSGFAMGTKARFILRGAVVQPNCPVADYAWQSPGSQLLLVFGSQLKGVTSVAVNGVNAPLFQEVDGGVLLVLFPPGVTLPWKPGTVQVTTNAGCSSSFPRPCGT